MLCIGEVCNGHTVDRLHRDAAVVAFSLPQTGRYNVLRHTVPEPQRSSNAGSAFIVSVIVGKAEHPYTSPIKRPCAIARSGKARVGGWLQLVRTERFLIDPVRVLLRVEGSDVLIAVIKAVAFCSGSPALCLLVNRGVDQIIAGGRKAYRLHDWLRLRFCRW